jgi:hypothetical protein
MELSASSKCTTPPDHGFVVFSVESYLIQDCKVYRRVVLVLVVKLIIGIKSIQDLSWCYLHRISGEESLPGTLSYLLSTKEADLMEIFNICGFYREMRGTFQWR